MTNLTIAFDPGSTLSRAFYTGSEFDPKLMLMEPEVLPVPRASIEAYEANQLGDPDPKDAAWVAYSNGNRCRAVGYLARTQFHGSAGLAQPKFEQAVDKVLALTGAIAQRESLPSQFKLSLGILLPWGEYQDREFLERQLYQALAEFEFRGQPLSVTLEQFHCLPEGGGLLTRGLPPDASTDCARAIVMLGYRNASVLAFERGALQRGDTSELGFARLVEKVSDRCSVPAQALAQRICEAGQKMRPKAFAQLARSSDPQLQQEECEGIARAVETARAEYWSMLEAWFREVLPAQLDEVVLSGGTANYLAPELKQHFAGIELNWCERIEDSVSAGFGDRLPHRLADAYTFFFYLHHQIKQKEVADARAAN